MKSYTWTINNQIWPNVTPIEVKLDTPVEAIITNNSMMSHPIHLHGYDFQVIQIDNKKINGAWRDTIIVQPHSKVIVKFYANNPGKWFFHCHSLYHMHSGMMAYIEVK